MRSYGIFFGLTLAAVLGAHFGGLDYLWVFPAPVTGLKWWFLVAMADACLARLQQELMPRLFLWCGGLWWFCGAASAPLLGAGLVALPPLLWFLSRRRPRDAAAVAVAVLLLLLLLGHVPRQVHQQGWIDPRLAVHLLAAFLFFRLVSWSVAVFLRKEKPAFGDSLEYFLSPVFWLSPLHASMMSWPRFSAKAPAADATALGWIAKGLGHALVFSWMMGWMLPWVNGLYQAGWRQWALGEAALLGPALFFLAYFEKARVSYLVAGYLRFAGRNVEPDFTAPWRAQNLLEYWRRFHWWVWEFYLEHLYTPLSVVLARRWGPRRAMGAALFLTFALGTFVSHLIAYQGGVLVTLALSLLFGFATWLHAKGERWMRRIALGAPLTWLTVFVLYALAYPALGLGWSTARYWVFLRGLP